VDACNPPTASAPDLGAGRTRRPRDFHLSHARLRPPRLSPLRVRPRARPIWAGARSTLTRRLRDPPVSKRRQKVTIIVAALLDALICFIHILVLVVAYIPLLDAMKNPRQSTYNLLNK
jgi:hypothetical protein